MGIYRHFEKPGGMSVFAFGAPKLNNVTTAELQKRLEAKEKLQIIDVREPWEFAQGHVPGSKLQPIGLIRTWAPQLKKNDEIFLICRTASRSAVAAQYLTAMGFTNVKNVSGGIVTWRGQVER